MKCLLFSDSSREKSAFPQELVEFSAKVAAVRASQSIKSNWESDRYVDFGVPCFHAPPIMPLNHRDLVALAGLFEREDIEDIETNLSEVLLSCLPEPCWEERVSEQSENFDFLADYL
ncbi:MAG: hypothetical protein SAJ37_16680 [Oscillatoria sp. PMC 1068.18]|nr:hypothetical protein [Oscillatoria sp. PMC 1076.18]MEC4990368.1 hypothetical protein [Oscillatoria sp. PMC 1068.18]